MNTIRFTIPQGHKVGDCAGDSHRYVLSDAIAFAGGEQTYLAATNGRVLAVLPVDTGDTRLERPVLLPSKAANTNGKPAAVEVNGEVRRMELKGMQVTKTEVFPLPEQNGRFPALSMVFPEDVAKAMNEYTAVSLDGKELARLAAALSPGSKLTLFIPPADKGQVRGAVLAVGTNENNPVGVGAIMPVVHYNREVLHSIQGYFVQHAANMPTDSIDIESAK